jgi:DNA-binding response OmpR family regulator
MAEPSFGALAVDPEAETPHAARMANEASQVSPVTLNCAKFHAYADGHLLPLTRLEFDILAYLMRHSPRVISQQELMHQVVHGVLKSDSSVLRVHVSHLRRKLGQHARTIATVRGRGFQYVDGLPIAVLRS